MAGRLQDVILRGLAAAKPAASTVAPGTLYYSTDTATTERSSGTAWETYSDGAAAGVNAIEQLIGDIDAIGPGAVPATINLNAITTPKIIDGAVTEAKQTLADNTTNNVTIGMHGYAPKAPNDATKFLDGTGAYDTVKDLDLALADVLTNDVSITKHGFVPKAPNDVTKYLDGLGAWSVPAGSGGGGGGGSSPLLGYVSYNPAVTANISVTSTAFVDIDATNLTITFTVPASGKVLIRLTAVATTNNAATSYVWNLRTPAGANIAGSNCIISSNTNQVRTSAAIVISGLTPGASVTYRWGHCVNSNTGFIRYGDDGVAASRYGPAVMEVWDAAIGTGVGSGALQFIEEQSPNGVSSFTFSSLGSFRHLYMEWIARADSASNNTEVRLQFNGDTGANYDRQLIQALGTTANGGESLAATSITIGNAIAATGTANACGFGTFSLPYYRETTFHKGYTATDGMPRLTTTSNFFAQLIAGRWRNTAAIASITILLQAGSFVNGSKFALYGRM